MAPVFAQTPTHYPTGSYPVTFTTGEILVYIVFPVLLFVFIIFSRRLKRSQNNEDENPVTP